MKKVNGRKVETKHKGDMQIEQTVELKVKETSRIHQVREHQPSTLPEKSEDLELRATLQHRRSRCPC